MGIVIRQGIKASFSNYIGIGLGIVSTFLLFPLFFTPEELGTFRLIIELTAAIYAFALLGVNVSINRYFPHFKNPVNKDNGFYFWALILPLTGFILVSIILTVWKDVFYDLFNASSDTLKQFDVILLVLIFCNLFLTVIETTSSNFGRIAKPFFIREVFIRGGLILAAFIFYLGYFTFIQMMWFVALAYLLAVGINYFFLRQLTKISLKPNFKFAKDNKPLFKDMKNYTFFLFFNGVAGLFINKIDFFIIGATLGMAETAIYSIGFYLATFIEIPKRSILQILTPIISKHMKEENYKEVSILYKKASLNQFLIASLLFLGIWINIDTAFLYMPKGDFYSQGKVVIFFIAISRLVEMIGTPASPILSTSKYYRYSFFNIIIAVFCAVLANTILIPKYGIMGGALAALLTASFNYGLAVFLVWIKLSINPFSKGLLQVFLICIPGIALASIGQWVDSAILDSIIKTCLIMPLTLLLIIKSKASPDFENTFYALLRRMKLIK
jgi:O-antigen/teichoic acid export membrane protein